MKRVEIVNFFLEKANQEGIIDVDTMEELSKFADWLDENEAFEEI